MRNGLKITDFSECMKKKRGVQKETSIFVLNKGHLKPNKILILYGPICT